MASMIQFNEDGSLKIPEHMLKDKQKEKESIILRRVQINRNNPAIAHLRIEIPEGTNISNEILKYYKEIEGKKFPSVNHNIKRVDNQTIIIEVKEGSWKMYSLLDYLIDYFKHKLEKNESVVVRGSWDKFDSDFHF